MFKFTIQMSFGGGVAGGSVGGLVFLGVRISSSLDPKSELVTAALYTEIC